MKAIAVITNSAATDKTIHHMGVTITWDGSDTAGKPLPSGVYYIRLSAPGEGGRIDKTILLR